MFWLIFVLMKLFFEEITLLFVWYLFDYLISPWLFIELSSPVPSHNNWCWHKAHNDRLVCELKLSFVMFNKHYVHTLNGVHTYIK